MKTCSVILVSALVELVAATDVEKVDDERMPVCPAGYRLYDGGDSNVPFCVQVTIKRCCPRRMDCTISRRNQTLMTPPPCFAFMHHRGKRSSETVEGDDIRCWLDMQ